MRCSPYCAAALGSATLSPMPPLSVQDYVAQFDVYAEANRMAMDEQGTADLSSMPPSYHYHRGRAETWEDAAVFLRENALLKWTNERPTVPGVYWMRIKASVGLPVARRVAQFSYGLGVDSPIGFVAIEDLDKEANLWAGPIVPPPVEETPVLP